MPTEPIILRPKNSRTILLLIMSLAFVAIGVWLILRGEPKGYWCIFFLLCAIVFTIQLMPNSTYIKLQDDGFEMVSLFKSAFIKWEEVDDFAPIVISGNELVGFNFTEKYHGKAKMRELNKSMVGREGCTAAQYSMKASELARLMQEMKDRSL